MSYLITCSGSKQAPIVHQANINDLSFQALQPERITILALSGIQLNWNETLPAWKLYSGNYSRLYPQVSVKNWNKPCVDIKILSALFGWIKHTDRIPLYNLQMTDRIGPHKIQVWRAWKNFNVLQNFFEENDIDLLSTNYRKAINGTGNPVAVVPPVIFTDRGVQKGIWLNSQLNLINC